MFKMLKKNEKGFTLIELLIVIGLLGALTSLVLPSLMGDRTEALLSVCDYNQAGTVRTLHQYENLMGCLPSGFHTGIDTDYTTAMDLPEFTADNLSSNGAVAALATGYAESLVNAGVTQLAYGDGYNLEDTDATSAVMVPSSTWVGDDETEATFDGILIEDWNDATLADGSSVDDGNIGKVIVLWVTPTIDWENPVDPNNDWSGGNFEMGIELAGKCPIPTDAEFTYYMAYIKAYAGTVLEDDGSVKEAKLIGTSCPECGIMNP